MSCQRTHPVAFLAGGNSSFTSLIAKKLREAGFLLGVTTPKVVAGDTLDECIHICPACVDDMSQLSAAIISTAERFGRIDWLIHCQETHARSGMILDTDDTQWDEVVTAWLRGAFFTCKCGIPYIMGSPDGRFIVFSSKDSPLSPIHERTRLGGFKELMDQAKNELTPVGIHVDHLPFGEMNPLLTLIEKCPLL